MNTHIITWNIMEPTLFEDNMEVGSDAGLPHPDNLDIEIDLDFAHDQTAGHDDDDVLVEDVSTTISDHGGEYREIADDADMVDEEYMDAHEAYRQGHEGSYQHDDGTTQPGYNEYEAEMEDEYEEDIDAPIPDSASDEHIPTGLGDAGKSEAAQPVSDTGNIGFSVSGASSTTVQELPENPPQEDSIKSQNENEEQPRNVDEKTSQQAEAKVVDDQTESAPEQTKVLDTDDQPVEVGHQEAGPETKEEGEPHVEKYGHKVSSEEQADAEGYEYVEHGDAEYYDGDYEEQQPEGHSGDSLPLHPIKVLYQESEISLFPPKEDDASETFFIEDETLAHEPLAKLLQAFRRVLGEDITQHEELLIDFESLGLQLSENIARDSSITLFQIIQTYLDLCHNDGTNKPEPLYLMLGSRPSFEVSYANLVSAAKDGQGLSHIHEWENYEAEHGEERDESHEEQMSAGGLPLSDADEHHDIELLNEKGEKTAPSSPKQVQVSEQEEPTTPGGDKAISGVTQGEEKPFYGDDVNVSSHIEVEPEGKSYHTDEPDVYEEGEWREDAEDVNGSGRHLVDDSHHESVEASTTNEPQATSLGEDQGDFDMNKHETIKEAPEQRLSDHDAQPDEEGGISYPEGSEYPAVAGYEVYGEAGPQPNVADGQRQEAHDEPELSTEQAALFNGQSAQLSNENDLQFDIDVETEESQVPEKHEEQVPEDNNLSADGDLEDDETYEESGEDLEGQGEPYGSTDSHDHEDNAPADNELEGGEPYEGLNEEPEDHEKHYTATDTRGHEKHSTDDVVDNASVARPKTPEPTSLLDIDEDLFRSPTAETYEAAQATNGQVTSAGSDRLLESGKHIPQHNDFYVTEGISAVGNSVDEPAPISQAKVEPPEGASGPSSQPGSPKLMKRSQIEAGINDGEGSLPEIKRQRST